MLCHDYCSAQHTNVPAMSTFRTHHSVLATKEHNLWKIKVTTEQRYPIYCTWILSQDKQNKLFTVRTHTKRIMSAVNTQFKIN